MQAQVMLAHFTYARNKVFVESHAGSHSRSMHLLPTLNVLMKLLTAKFRINLMTSSICGC